MIKLLYVDACVNRSISRTERLAQVLIERLFAENDCEMTAVVLEDEDLRPLTGKLVNERAQGTMTGDFSHPVFAYAKQFAEADVVVFAAPYWDFSFPSMLKVYLEYLCAQGVTFNYSAEGVPTGLTHIKKVYYVTTSGGYIGAFNFGFDQVKNICQLFFGVPEVQEFRAEGLDIVTNDVEAIMAEAIARIEQAQL